MADVDNNDDQSQAPQTKSEDAINQKFDALAEQLRVQNEQFQQSFQALSANIAPKAPAQKEAEIDPYDPESVKAYLSRATQEITKSASETVNNVLSRERALQSTVSKLAQEYPEINSDPDVLQSVLAEHKKLSKGLQETAEGYELAVARATASKGLVPRSKRKTSSSDEYISSGSSRSGGSSREKKSEVSDKTKLISQLLGRDVDSKEYKESIQKVLGRKSMTRYE